MRLVERHGGFATGVPVSAAGVVELWAGLPVELREVAAIPTELPVKVAGMMVFLGKST